MGKRKTTKRTNKKGLADWVTDHVRPGVTFDHDIDDEAYWEQHGGRPSPTDVDKWMDYVEDNATFWLKFRFDF